MVVVVVAGVLMGMVVVEMVVVVVAGVLMGMVKKEEAHIHFHSSSNPRSPTPTNPTLTHKESKQTKKVNKQRK